MLLLEGMLRGMNDMRSTPMYSKLPETYRTTSSIPDFSNLTSRAMRTTMMRSTIGSSWLQ